MTRLRALNVSSSEDSDDDSEERETREAQEERAFSLYKRALGLRQSGKYVEAEELLVGLLDCDFLIDVTTEEKQEGADLARPAVALKYACLKNLGGILILQGRALDGLDCLTRAVELDGSDITLWQQLGNVALEVDNFHLASYAFQEGLRCNRNHWPCLDSLLSVQFALDDYLGCLLLMSHSLQLDPDYPKALAFHSQIIKEQPSLLRDFKYFYPDEHDMSIVDACLDKDEEAALIAEARALQERRRKKEEYKWDEQAPGFDAPLMVSLQSQTWLDLGQSLLRLHARIISDRSMSFLHHIKVTLPEMPSSTLKSDVSEEMIEEAPTQELDSSKLVSCPAGPSVVLSASKSTSVVDTASDPVPEQSIVVVPNAPTAADTVQEKTVQEIESNPSLEADRERGCITDASLPVNQTLVMDVHMEEPAEAGMSDAPAGTVPPGPDNAPVHDKQPDESAVADLPAVLPGSAVVTGRAELTPLTDVPENSVVTTSSPVKYPAPNLCVDGTASDDTRTSVHAVSSESTLTVQIASTETQVPIVVALPETSGVAGGDDSEAMEADSEREEPKVEEQTEEDATEASGQEQEQEEEVGTQITNTSKPHLIPNKRKRKRTSTALMDQWSKRRSGRRSGRRGEVDRDESNLAATFRANLPPCLLPKDLETDMAWASKRRLMRDPVDLLSWAEDSMDTMELYRLLQERDAKESQNQQRHSRSKENVARVITEEGYFGNNQEKIEVTQFVEQHGSGAENIMELILAYVIELSAKDSITWLTDLITVYVEAFECMRQHIPHPAPFGDNESFKKLHEDAVASLLYCEFFMDSWLHREQKEQDKLTRLSSALGHLLFVAPQDHLFSSAAEQWKFMLRLHWLKAHFFLCQDNSGAAICALHDTLDGLELMEKEELRNENSKGKIIDESDNLSIERPKCISLEERNIEESKNQEVPSDPHTKFGQQEKGSDGLWETNVLDSTNLQTKKGSHLEDAESVAVAADQGCCKDGSAGANAMAGEESSTNSSKAVFNIMLRNCSANRNINKSSVRKLLLSLTRQQQLSEIDDLYENQNYDALVDTLTGCFKHCAQNVDTNFDSSGLPDRPTQMAMLLDALWQLQRYGDCFYWGEACLHEAWNRYMSRTETDADEQQMWATTIERLLSGLDSCLKSAGHSSLERLPAACLTRLVQTLTSLLCQQLEQSDGSLEMAIECITPWILLFHIVQFEEQRQQCKPDSIPSSIMILFTAHEYMAKQNRCCLNEGVLLSLILDVIVPRLHDPELAPYRDELNPHVEQAIYCMYGHPKKANNVSRKRLQDHKVPNPLTLTWDRCLVLLSFYQPDELPTFDSRTSIHADEEQLFLRILSVVPEECSPKRSLDDVKAFIQGKSESPPEMNHGLPEPARDLFYLLADNYLKTYKWESAVFYYMQDVSLNPHRFDSWAGMALARSTLLSTKLNSCDTLKSDVQLRDMMEAHRCFERAVQLEPDHATMWIEYGNFAYVMHSFCSRLLKTETDSLSLEMFSRLEEDKDNMLTLAEKCFTTAEQLGQDERWLHQYMLGKVAEKRGESPAVFLHHYQLAAQLLFESNAKYPLTLNYDPPQLYAFEAHEVHYRIHASILKNLEIMEGKQLDVDTQALYERTLASAARSPFMIAAAGRANIAALNLSTLPQGPAPKRKSAEPVPDNTEKKLKLNNTAEVVNLVEEDECHIVDEKAVSAISSCASQGQETSKPVNVEKCSSGVADVGKVENTKPSGSLTQERASNTASHNQGNVVQLETERNISPSLRLVDDLMLSDSSKGADDVALKTVKEESLIDTSVLDTNVSLEGEAKIKTLMNVKSRGQAHGLTNTNVPGVVVHGVSPLVKEHDYAAPYEGASVRTSHVIDHVSGDILRTEVGYDSHQWTKTALDPNKSGILQASLLDDANLKMSFDSHDVKGSSDRHDVNMKPEDELKSTKSPTTNFGPMDILPVDVCGASSICGSADALDNLEVEGEIQLVQERRTLKEGEEEDLPENKVKGTVKEEESSSTSSSSSSSSSSSGDSSSSDDSSSTSSSDSSSGDDSCSDDTETKRRHPEENTNAVDPKVELGISTPTQADPALSVASESQATQGPDIGSNSQVTCAPKRGSAQAACPPISELLAPPEAQTSQVAQAAQAQVEKVLRVNATKMSDVDHSPLVKACLSAMEECLARYPRHYKSLYRLCHYYFTSKRHRNLGKCRQLLLDEYRIPGVHKKLNGLFKCSNLNLNTMFNDMWRIPVEEVDRAGSFASHMSRCVILLMELLKEMQDHGMLLRLCIFLRKEPEKDKKYLRDNERVDLSQQALVMCLNALRARAKQIRSVEILLDLFTTVREGSRELPAKESTFRTVLSDAYKNMKNIKSENMMYEAATEFCNHELSVRKATVAVQVAQAQAKALQMGSPLLQSGMSGVGSQHFSVLQPRFPTGINSPPVRANMGSRMFMPQLPVHRGRGRPPKARFNQIATQYLKMAQGQGNYESYLQYMKLQEKKQKQQQQQQRHIQQQASSSANASRSIVSEIAKERPSLSITALQPKSLGQMTVAGSSPTVSVSSSSSTLSKVSSSLGPKLPSSVDSLPRVNQAEGQQQPWQNIHRQSAPRQLTPRQMAPRQVSPRMPHIGNRPAMGVRKPMFYPTPRPVRQVRPSRPYASHNAIHKLLDNSVAMLARLPGLELQVKQRPQAASAQCERDRDISVMRQLPQQQRQQQPQQQVQTASTSLLQQKPNISISKVTATPQSNSGTTAVMSDGNVQKKSQDPNFEIITLE